MIKIRNLLTDLRKYEEQLTEEPSAEPDRIKKEAFKTLSQLNAILKDQELTPEEWNEIFESIQPFSQFDLATERSLKEKIFSVFSSRVSTEKAVVKDFIAFVDQRRTESTTTQFKLERATVRFNYQTWLHTVASTEISFTPTTIRNYILMVRKENPRSLISLQDEVMILSELIQEKIEGFQILARETESENLKKLLTILNDNLFTFENYIEKKETPNELGITILQADREDLSKEAIEKLWMHRLFRLENLESVYQQSLKNPSTRVATKFFPPTYAWYIGSFQRDPEYSLLELEMQQIGQENGIKVISDARFDNELRPVKMTEQYRTNFMLNCLPLAEDFGLDTLGPFPQDYVDFSLNGEVRIPRIKRHKESPYSILKQTRCHRSPEWKKIIDENRETPIPLLGAPFENNYGLKAIALASSLEATSIMNLTYSEGGNVLIGQRKEKPYIIVGRDSYDLSKYLMEKDLGRTLTEEEVRMAFAIDYGVTKENVFFVEQPGDFHLDMSMAIIGENTIILNDAEIAQKKFAEEQNKWLQDTIDSLPSHSSLLPDCKRLLSSYIDEEIRESAVRKKMEDLTAKDLEKAGFKVIRAPGRFHYSSRKPAMNLFNMVTAETPNGQKIAILLGCINQKYENFFIEIMNENSDQKIDRFYFLQLNSSQNSLIKGGGISCRTKIIPQSKRTIEK